jgi:hypothetical protein
MHNTAHGGELSGPTEPNSSTNSSTALRKTPLDTDAGTRFPDWLR